MTPYRRRRNRPTQQTANTTAHNSCIGHGHDGIACPKSALSPSPAQTVRMQSPAATPLHMPVKIPQRYGGAGTPPAYDASTFFTAKSYPQSQRSAAPGFISPHFGQSFEPLCALPRSALWRLWLSVASAIVPGSTSARCGSFADRAAREAPVAPLIASSAVPQRKQKLLTFGISAPHFKQNIGQPHEISADPLPGEH